jgi:hypothetical protein
MIKIKLFWILSPTREIAWNKFKRKKWEADGLKKKFRSLSCGREFNEGGGVEKERQTESYL